MPILKIKTQDFKKLSKQFEDEAKKKSESKKKVKKMRINVDRSLVKPIHNFEEEFNPYMAAIEEKKNQSNSPTWDNPLIQKYKMVFVNVSKEEKKAILTQEEKRLENERNLTI